MRNELLRARPTLGLMSPGYRTADEFYKAVEELRTWTRSQPNAQGGSNQSNAQRDWDDYTSALDGYADEVRTYLGTPAKGRGDPPRPDLPRLR